MTSFAINAEKREQYGKSATRKLRNNGKLPAIIYGKNQENHAIAVDYKDLTQIYKKGGFYTKICEITISGKVIKVIPKEITLHPVTDNIEHIDFYMLNDKEKVKIKANIKFTNEARCAGVKKGGVLNITTRKIELLCYPSDIISEITVDLANLNIGESIHINDIKLPENVTISKKSSSLTIVTLVGRVEEETTETNSGKTTDEEKESSTETEDNNNKQE